MKLQLGDILACTDIFNEEILPKMEGSCRKMSEYLLGQCHRIEGEFHLTSSGGGIL